MLQLDMQGGALANTRFALSPIGTAVGALWLLRDDASAAGAGWRTLVKETVRDRKLTLLRSFFAGTWTYVPDFITPPVTDETLQSDLHAVATVAAARVRFEMELMLHGNAPERLTGRGIPAVVRDVLEGGEAGFAQRVAAELDQLWAVAIGPRWPRLRARLEADIAHRARAMARNGLAEVLAGLHPHITWNGGSLGLMVGLQGRVSGSTSLVLTPSPFGHRPRFVIDSIPAPVHRQPMLTYPALAGRDERALPADTLANHELIGATRARLLADLHDSARTTSELGERHRLSVGTVSYHLGILHRAGLVTRTRTGQSVLYRQTPHAAALLDADGRAEFTARRNQLGH